MGAYDLQTYWKGLKVKDKNHTKIANSKNKQKPKTPSLNYPWLGGRKGEIIEKVHYYNLILNKDVSKFIYVKVITETVLEFLV